MYYVIIYPILHCCRDYVSPAVLTLEMEKAKAEAEAAAAAETEAAASPPHRRFFASILGVSSVLPISGPSLNTGNSTHITSSVNAPNSSTGDARASVGGNHSYDSAVSVLRQLSTLHVDGFDEISANEN